MPWDTNNQEIGTIWTPRGIFKPTTDDAVEALAQAARHAGLSKFRVTMPDGTEIAGEAQLPSRSLREIAAQLRIEGPGPVLTVSPYDKAGR